MKEIYKQFLKTAFGVKDLRKLPCSVKSCLPQQEDDFVIRIRSEVSRVVLEEFVRANLLSIKKKAEAMIPNFSSSVPEKRAKAFLKSPEVIYVILGIVLLELGAISQERFIEYLKKNLERFPSHLSNILEKYEAYSLAVAFTLISSEATEKVMHKDKG